MSKRVLSLLLAGALAFTLTAGTAAAAAPTGFTLFDLSAEPLGGIAGFYLSATLVAEDGTTLSCPQGEMTVTRQEVRITPYDGYSDFNLEPGETFTAAAGQAVPITGQTVYTFSAAVGGQTECLSVTTRTAANLLCTYDDVYACGWLEWETIPGSTPLKGSDYVTASNPLQGYAVLREDYSGFYASQGFYDDSEFYSGIHESDVYLVLPSGTKLSVPEGYVMTTGIEGFFGLGGPGGFDSGWCEVMAGGLTWAAVSPCGGNTSRESFTVAVFGDDEYSREEQQFIEVVWLTQEDLNSQNQYASSWAKDQTEQAIQLGLMTYPAWSNLQRNTTRGEFAELIVRLYETITGQSVPALTEEQNPFEDVSAFYDPEILKAYSLGLVYGASDTLFSPDGELTREQAAVLISRLAAVLGKPLADQPAGFSDNGQISSWAAKEVGQVQGAGIMGGVGDNKFDPQGSFTREQSVLTAVRLLDMMG